MAGRNEFLLLLYAFVGCVAALGRWVGDGESPWQGKTANASHPTYDMPDTGETRYYDFTISRAIIAPDGVEKSAILVNEMFPGPLIEANWGDWIEINVHNAISGPEEPTTLHWHGLNMDRNPWMDGIPITTQCPIIPGQNLTYRFRADEYGTSWYHSHVAAQYSQGIVGPIVIHGPSDYVEYDDDLGPVLVTDWYHRSHTELAAQALGPLITGPDDIRPLAESNLLAGVGRYPCANITDGRSCVEDPTYQRWSVEPGKTYRMRFVNTGSIAFFRVSLDNHPFKVIAVDFVPVEPFETDHIYLSVGQRVDVLFTASADSTQSYWLRASNNNHFCADTKADYDGMGIIHYPDAPVDTEPQSLSNSFPENPLCDTGDISQVRPLYQMPVEEPDLVLSFSFNGVPVDGQLRIVTNNQTFDSATLYQNPVLHSVLQGVASFPPEQHVYSTGAARIVRLILRGEFLPPHPMHLHGHDFQVLAQGVGEWDGTIINPDNPLRRDVQQMHSGANVLDPTGHANYVVIQYEADNPGVWPLHCHFAWHLAAGMVVLLVEQPDELMAMAGGLPSEILETCTLYREWAGAHTWGEEGPGGGQQVATGNGTGV